MSAEKTEKQLAQERLKELDDQAVQIALANIQTRLAELRDPVRQEEELRATVQKAEERHAEMEQRVAAQIVRDNQLMKILLVPLAILAMWFIAFLLGETGR